MKKIVSTISLLLAIAMLFSLSACGISMGKSADKSNTLYAFVNADNNAVLYFDNDKVLKIPNARNAAITGDKKNIVWVTTDNEIYTVASQKDKTNIENGKLIGENVEYLQYLRNAGLIFSTLDRTYYYYRFNDGSAVEISKEINNEIDTFIVSEDLSTFYYTANGKIYCFKSNTSEKIKSFDKDNTDIWFETLSDDGKYLVWSELSNENIDMYFYNGIDSEKVCSMKGSGTWYSGSAYFNKSQDQIMLLSAYDKSVYLLTTDGKVEEIRFKGEIFNPQVITGDFSECTSKVTEIYCGVDDGDNRYLYWGDTNGNTEKLISGIKNFGLSGGKLYYHTEENDLCVTVPNGRKTDSGEKIAGEITTMDIAPENGIVYYMKDGEEKDGIGQGTLFVYKAGDKEPTRVASEVNMYYHEYTYIGVSARSTFKLADNGNSVLYIKDTEKDANDNQFGTLYLYRVGSDAPIRITSDSSKYFRYENDTIKSDSFYIEKYDYTDSDGNTFVSWYYYDGKDIHLVARDVKY